jgi:hypothetical protein
LEWHKFYDWSVLGNCHFFVKNRTLNIFCAQLGRI